MSKNREVNKKCAELMSYKLIDNNNDPIITVDVPDYGYIFFNIYDSERVDAYKVAEKLEIETTKASHGLGFIWKAGNFAKLIACRDKDQHTAIVKCIEAVIGDA